MADGPPPRDRPPALRAMPDALPTDAELVARSLEEPEQFAALFDRHATAVHRYLGRRVGDLADDLLSETFLVAFRRRAAYRAEHVDVRPWLFGVATNLVHGHARTERRRYRALARAGVEPPTGAGADEVHARVDAAALRGPLAYEEIAVVLDIPIGTVRSRLNRARRQTRAALAPLEETR